MTHSASDLAWERTFVDVHLITLAADQGWGVIRDGAVAVAGGRVAWVGPASALPSGAPETISCGGAWMTPGLIDCHTHLVYGGHRIGEFERRLNGESYAEIAAAGGGIRSTVAATRAASADALLASAAGRLAHFLSDGVTTLEIKSGYGLDLESEIKMLEVVRRLGETHPVTIVPTFLGAHAVPPEYAHDRAGYIDLLCQEMIPRVAETGLAAAVDGFCETIAFSAAEIARVFDAAVAHGLRVKLHADQLSDGGGAALAARYGALSADHIEYTSLAGVAAMAAAGTVAVVLPGAFYALGETQPPPVAALRAHGVPLAIASDCNPGSSPVLSLRLMINMACVLFGLTPEEAVRGVTVNAARALGFTDRGRLAPGQRADFALWNITEPAELAYAIGGALCLGAVYEGRSPMRSSIP